MFLQITIYILAAAISLMILYLFFSRTIWDKLLVLNLINIKILLLLSCISVLQNNTFLLDISLTLAIIGFIAIILFSRFITDGGRTK